MVRLGRSQAFLILATVAPVVGILVVLLAPPPQYGYLVEQAFLLVFALAALVAARARPTGAILGYCTLALGPMGAMIARYEVLVGGFNPWIFTPHLGIMIVAWATRDERAAWFYGLVAWAVSGWYGLLCNDVGQSGWAMITSAIVAVLAVWWIDDRNIQRAIEKTEIIQDGLDFITEIFDGRQN